MRNHDTLAKIWLVIIAIGLVAAIVLTLIGCEKETQVFQPEPQLENRAGLKLPIFYAASLTTDNWLLQGQPEYQNIQNVWNKSYVDSVTLQRSQNTLTNIAGVLCGIYRVRVYDADTIIFQDEMFAKNGPDQYTVVPQGQSLLTAYNQMEIIRTEIFEMYFDFGCGVIKRRYMYHVFRDDEELFPYINSQHCASPWFRLNHAH